jgi:hypothetical protein
MTQHRTNCNTSPSLVDLRDTFAAAALTGLLANPRHDEDNTEEICHWAWNWAEVMLREREKSRSGQNDAETVPQHAKCTERDRFAKPMQNEKSAEVLPRPYEICDEKRSFSRTNHDAAPAELVARTRHVADSLEAIAKCDTDSPQPFAAAYAVYLNGEYDSSYGPDAIDEALEIAADCHGEVVPLYRTPQAHATPGEGSVQGEGTEPVAWAVVGRCIRVMGVSKESVEEEVKDGERLVPLYTHPVPPDRPVGIGFDDLRLTDEEREAIEEVVAFLEPPFLEQKHPNYIADTLRSLLDRLA